MGRSFQRRVKNAILHVDRVAGTRFRQMRYGKHSLEDSKVFFSTYQGTYACNPKYITEYLLRHYPELDIVWAAKADVAADPAAHGFPAKVRVVSKDSSERFYEQSTAKVWVDNALTCLWRKVEKRPGQFYYNTWHGSLGIKRLDTQKDADPYWAMVARESDRMLDGMFVNSSFEESVFTDAFWPTCSKLLVGQARNDLFFDGQAREAVRQRVCSRYCSDAGMKLALYAPTFRDGADSFAMHMDTARIRAALSERFGGEWIILMRLHPRERDVLARMPKGCVDTVDYPDIQELIAAADVGITDYSSWIFDFALTGRPGFLFAYDKDRYEGGRGLYYPLEETPFPLATSSEELKSAIRGFDDALFSRKMDSFLKGKGCIEDGRAAERVAKLIVDAVKTR